MAVREGQGLRGGYGRWISDDDVRLLRDELQEVATSAELRQWALSSRLAPVSSHGRPMPFACGVYGGEHGASAAGGRGAPGAATRDARGARGVAHSDDRAYRLGPPERREVLAVAVAELAAHRRNVEAWRYAEDRGLDLYVALGGAEDGRSLLRCPHCDAPQRSMMQLSRLYCRRGPHCQAAEEAEVAALLDASGVAWTRRNRRTASASGPLPGHGESRDDAAYGSG